MNSTELKLDIIKKSPGIFINTSEDSFCLNHKHVELLNNEIPVSHKARWRICVHKSNDAQNSMNKTSNEILCKSPLLDESQSIDDLNLENIETLIQQHKYYEAQKLLDGEL